MKPTAGKKKSKKTRPPKLDKFTASLRLAKRPQRQAGRPCHLCSHPLLKQATADIVAGVPTRAIGKKYGCSAMAVSKHIRKHMGQALLQHDIAAPVLDQLRSLQQRTDRILAKAELAEDLSTALRGVHEARENLMSIARLTGEDRSQQVANTRIEISYVDKASERESIIAYSASKSSRVKTNEVVRRMHDNK